MVMNSRTSLRLFVGAILLAGLTSAVSMRARSGESRPAEQWRELIRSQRLTFPTRLCNEWRKLPQDLQRQKIWDLANECDPRNDRRSWLSATVLEPEFIPAGKFKTDPLTRLSELSAVWIHDLGASKVRPNLKKETEEVVTEMVRLANDQVAAALLFRKLSALGFEILDRLESSSDCREDQATWAALRLSFEDLSWPEAQTVLERAKKKLCFN